ncbi:AEC family transporter [Natronospora cellulosivora (SeqCode)]
MDIYVLVNQILVLFLIILLGFILRKRDIFTEDMTVGLSRILIEIIIPALIIDAMLSITLSAEIIRNLILMTIMSFLAYFFVLLFASVISIKVKTSKAKKDIFKFLLIFGNVGYMGIPVISSVFSPEAVVYIIINNIIFNVYIWTYGVQLLTRDHNKESKIEWKKLINNGTIALIIGFFLLITQINIGPLRGSIEIVADMTFPLSMLIIGSSLSNVKIINVIKDKYIYYVIFLKLIFIPLLALFVLKNTALPTILVDTLVILLAMPSGANTVIFAEKYKSDYKFASEGVFITTLLSLFTIPLFITLITLF